MKGIKVGGIYLLACLFYARSEEVNASEDLKDRTSEDVSRSGAIAESFAFSDDDEALSQSNAETSSGDTAIAQSYASSSNGVNSAKANSVAKGDSQAIASSSSSVDQLSYPPASGILYGGGNSAKAKSIAKSQANSENTNYPVDWLAPEGSSANSDAETLVKLPSNVQKPKYYSGTGPNMYQPGYEYPGSIQWNLGEGNEHSNIDSLISKINPYGGSLYQPRYSYSEQSGLGNKIQTSKAQATAQATSSSQGGQRPYSGSLYQPSYLHPSQVTHPGTAQAQTDDQGFSGVPNGGQTLYKKPPFQPTYFYPGQDTQWNQHGPAEMKFQPGYGYSKPDQSPYGRLMYQPGYIHPGQGSQEASAKAEAETQEVSGSNINGINNPGYNIYTPGYQTDTHGSSGKNSGSVIADARTRVIQGHEYIYPHLMPGYDNSVFCSRFGELHYLQSSLFGCMVCVCVNENGLLLPACARCSACFVPEPEPFPPQPPLPPNPPRPLTTTVAPIPPAPEPHPEPQVSCDPLPTNKPFENPMNPCQICVCLETYNFLMKTEVRIECQQNPQCVIPQDVTILPPLPDGPIPLPICERFPMNVVFPHPNDACKLCKCSVGLEEYGKPQPQIECTLNPECNPVTYQPEPSPFPEISTIVPWIMPTPAPHPPKSGPGPLPGPKPHESCRPFKPDQPFQHPWDECQMCICSEYTSAGLITIEVNCYTKSSCCYELPELIGTTSMPYIPDLQILDSICEMKTFGVEFTHPQDVCKTCFCDLKGSTVRPVCFKSTNPECQKPIYPDEGDVYTAEAHAAANSQSGGTSPINFSPGVNGNGYNPAFSSTSSSQASAVAQAQAFSQESSEGLLGQVHYQYKPGKQYPGQSQYVPVYNYGNVNYPEQYYIPGHQGYWDNQGVLDKQQLIGSDPGQWGINRGYWPYQQPRKPQAYEKADFDTMPGSLNEYTNMYPTYYYPSEMTIKDSKNKVTTLGGIDNLAEQEASNAWLLKYNKLHLDNQEYYYPGGKRVDGKGNDLYSGSSAAANAAATAVATNAKSGYPFYNSHDGIPASSLYSNLFNRPSYQITPLYINEKGSDGSVPMLNPGLDFKGSGGVATANSSAQSQVSSAKSQAQARTRVEKSGNPEDFDDEESI